MIGTLILSHGNLADELLSAARTISGDLEGFGALSLDWSDGFDEAQTRIAEALGRLDTGDGVLVLTDMFGGTPCNVALTFHEPGNVEIVTGVNLPMVVRLACRGKREKPVQEVARWLREKGRTSICLASDVQSERCCALPPTCPSEELAEVAEVAELVEVAEAGEIPEVVEVGEPVAAGRGDGG